MPSIIDLVNRFRKVKIRENISVPSILNSNGSEIINVNSGIFNGATIRLGALTNFVNPPANGSVSGASGDFSRSGQFFYVYNGNGVTHQWIRIEGETSFAGFPTGGGPVPPTVTDSFTLNATMTVGTAGILAFEGSSNDAFETILGVTNPTADTTWNIPAKTAGTYTFANLESDQTFAGANTFNGASIFNSTVTVAGTLTATASGNKLKGWEIKTVAFNAIAGGRYMCNTSSTAYSATLPASPTDGDEIEFIDSRKTWDTNNLTIVRAGGKTIDGDASDLICDIEGDSVTLIYENNNWIVK